MSVKITRVDPPPQEPTYTISGLTMGQIARLYISRIESEWYKDTPYNVLDKELIEELRKIAEGK